MLKKLPFILILLVITPIIGINAQSIKFNTLNVEDGLPSNEVNDMLQGNLGYLWFATSSGIVKYNGHSMYLFNKDDGIPENSVVKLYQDHYNRIWFSTVSGYFGYIKNDSIHNYPKVPSYEGRYSSCIANFHLDQDDLLWITSYYYGELFTVDSLYNFKQVKHLEKTNKNVFFQHFDNEFIYEKKKVEINNGDIEFDHNNSGYFLLENNTNSSVSLSFTKHPDGRIFFSKHNILYTVSQAGEISDLVLHSPQRNKILKVYCDSKGDLWVSWLNKGLFRYKNSDLESDPDLILENVSVTTIVEDFEGTYWFSTAFNGIFYLSNFGVRQYDLGKFTSNTNIRNFFSDANKVLIQFENDDILISERENNKLSSFQNARNLLPGFSRMVQMNDNKVLLYTTEGIISDLKGNSIGLGKSDKYPDIFQEIGSEEYILGSTNGITVWENGETVYITNQETGYNGRISDIFVDDNNICWVGTHEGLMVYKNKKLTFDTIIQDLENKRITDIDGNGDLKVIGTYSEGLFLTLKDEQIHLNIESGLPTNQIRCLAIESEKRVWVGTNIGLVVLDIHSKNRIDQHIIQQIDGLLSNEIKDLDILDNTLWISSHQGLNSIKIDEILPLTKKARLFVSSIQVNQEEISIKDTLIFNSNENNIRFMIEGISFRFADQLKYFYRIKDQSKEWIEIAGGIFSLNNLQAGTYPVVIRMTSPNGSQVEKTFHITIKRHYSDTWWFILLIGFISVSITVLIAYLIVLQIKSRAELRRNALISKQEALRAQMNPHFIFNSLNSIQNFIYKSDKKASLKYMISFSRLIRMTLDFSKKEMITLDEEIGLLKLYIELEQLRFTPAFEFNINIDQEIDQENFYIPPMLLQPILENAIWHGLMPKENNRTLTLSLEKSNSFSINCIVEDNGIGRENAGRIIRKSHTSTGLKNTTERIEILKATHSAHISMEIIDLKDNSGKPSGTKVKIELENLEHDETR